MRALILISGIFFLINAVMYLLPTDIETSNLKYASDPEINQSDIRFLRKEQDALSSGKFGQLSGAQADTVGSSQSTSSDQAAACFRIGPFLRETRVKTASKHIEDLAIDYQLIVRQPNNVKASRVFVGPFEGASEAVVARKKLTDGGINDHFHRRESDESYIVSLGIYSKKESAVNQQSKFREKNIAAKVREEQTRLPKSFWIELSASTEKEKLESLSDVQWGESSVSAGMHKCKART